jgi:hypothetical protein
LIQITNEDLYSAAFYYAVGIISGMPYYENMHPEEIANNILLRAEDVINQYRLENGINE